jgi:NQR2, RnfD, RnfE family
VGEHSVAGARGGGGPLAWLKRAGVEPESCPPSLVAGLALAPPVVVGLLLFRLTALEDLAVAVAAGLAAHLAARLLDQPLDGTPLLPALVGVALVDAGAPLPWTAAVAVAAAGLELGRGRFLPGARLQVGLVAYELVLLLARGDPALSGTGAVGPDSPVRLYVGNVAGPVFATSVLAVAIGAAWLWYARRLSLLVVLTFLAGALAAVASRHWSAAYRLDSGPLWFAAALVLADRRTLPASALGRPLAGFVAGVAAFEARSRGLALEPAPLAVAAVQLLTVAVQGAVWVRGHGDETRARLREVRDGVLALGRPNRPDPAQR